MKTPNLDTSLEIDRISRNARHDLSAELAKSALTLVAISLFAVALLAFRPAPIAYVSRTVSVAMWSVLAFAGGWAGPKLAKSNNGIYWLVTFVFAGVALAVAVKTR